MSQQFNVSIRGYERKAVLVATVAIFVIGLTAAALPLDGTITFSLIGLLVILTLIAPMAALGTLLVLAPLRTLIATESQFALPLDIGQLVLIASLAIWFIASVSHGKSKLRHFWTPVSGALIAFLLITGLSAFNALSLSSWLSEWLKWAQMLLVITCILNLPPTYEKWQWVLFIIVMSGTANAIVGIYQFFGGSGAIHLLINDRFFRAFGTFGQPNPFGGFMGMTLPLSVAGFIGYALQLGKYSKHRTITYHILITYYFLCSLLLIAGIIMSWSRGAWLGLTGAVFAAAFMFPRNRRLGLIALAFFAAVTIFVWSMGLIPTSLVDRLVTSTTEYFAIEDVRGVDITPLNYAVMERLAHWQAAVNMAANNSLLGIGFGNYEIAYSQYRLLNWTESLGHAHNYYLNLLAEIGVLGLIGYGKVIFSILSMLAKALAHPDDMARLLVIGVFSSWIYILIHSIFDNLFVNNLFLHMAVILSIGILLYNEASAGIRIIE
ncbi:MAG: O-antigen ligase family protein [Anaerolineae bacterium]